MSDRQNEVIPYASKPPRAHLLAVVTVVTGISSILLALIVVVAGWVEYVGVPGALCVLFGPFFLTACPAVLWCLVEDKRPNETGGKKLVTRGLVATAGFAVAILLLVVTLVVISAYWRT